MEIDEFLKIGTEDQETNQKITELTQDPEFLDFLVETLSSEEVHANDTLLTKVLIAFFEIFDTALFYE